MAEKFGKDLWTAMEKPRQSAEDGQTRWAEAERDACDETSLRDTRQSDSREPESTENTECTYNNSE